ncbi:GNAT family N-acetyltransferase [Enterococcus sp. DIV0242_7C1]|uniref:N-acetyltransferase domain-containing protein n=1 Tax=Candidatus Enterococcus dunnyi TaxID=1834192 RepID=A0A200JAG2_9ENTE|nr:MULTISPECIES: GNAT family N-acetyltransferase [unclassified Enterococcus]MBO0471406.1 GNAT family N-acetyltransferase [Enterococcus sp. DIV0242_7C1]OUZ33660.1 hypothetical protein A5889_002375 [Enterococcus sp. 9D6_DIV0238]
MIKKVEKLNSKELEEILEIWLTVNIEAHFFIPKNYWLEHLESVKEQLPLADLYLAIENDTIVGFLGLSNTYIAGIFVLSAYQNQKIGESLLNEVKSVNNQLSLSVYQKNQKALAFYLKHDFQIIDKQIDANDELEYQLIWKK